MSTHFIILHWIILIMLGKEYKSWSSSLYNVLYPAVTSSLFGPNILLSTLFPNTFSLCSFLHFRAKVSHPYRTTGKIIVLHILIFTFLDIRQDRTSVLDWTVASITKIQSRLNFLLNYILICYCCSEIFKLWHIFIWSISYFYSIWLPLMWLCCQLYGNEGV
jgi:hypothetical protein